MKKKRRAAEAARTEAHDHTGAPAPQASPEAPPDVTAVVGPDEFGQSDNDNNDLGAAADQAVDQSRAEPFAPHGWGEDTRLFFERGDALESTEEAMPEDHGTAHVAWHDEDPLRLGGVTLPRVAWLSIGVAVSLAALAGLLALLP